MYVDSLPNCRREVVRESVPGINSWMVHTAARRSISFVPPDREKAGGKERKRKMIHNRSSIHSHSVKEALRFLMQSTTLAPCFIALYVVDIFVFIYTCMPS